MSFNAENRTVLVEPGRFRSAYSRKPSLSVFFPENSPHTRQEFKEECDINTIMSQYMTSGEIFHINEAAPQYLDCTGFDFRTQMDFVAGAYSMFEELPSSIRLRFDNDPAEFLDFCSQEKNRPEMAQMGLLSDEAVARMSTPRVDSPSPSTASTEAPSSSSNSEPPSA